MVVPLPPDSACPVEPAERTWIEQRMGWLARQFGWERLRSAAVVLPTEEFFPDPFSGKPEDGPVMLARVCGYLGIDPGTVELSFFADRNPVHDDGGQLLTFGLYEETAGGFRVWIDTSNLADPLALIATLAHELGHVHLLGHRRTDAEVPDMEPLTDLLTVFLGLGVITANAVLQDRTWRLGHWEGWNMSRRGYLSMPAYGYALALFAHQRGEAEPPWSSYLRPDVRAAFRKGLQFLAAGWVPDFKGGMPATEEKPDGTEADEEAGEQTPVCVRCGVNLEAPGACRRCQKSIDENIRDIYDEEKAREDDYRRGRAILLWGCSLLLLFVLGTLGVLLLMVFLK